jgi:DNA mismatch repair protein MutL
VRPADAAHGRAEDAAATDAAHGRAEDAAATDAAEPSASSPRTPERSDWVFAAQQPLLGDSDRAAAAGDQPLVVEDRAAEPLHFGSLRRVGQLLASYLLVEGKRGLILVDQHAAHERVLYEQLRAEWLANGVSSQPLLLPETVEVDALALAALLEAAELCGRLGFDLAAFGDRAVLVRAIPSLLAGRDPAALVRGLAEELRSGERGGEGAAATDALPSDVRLVAAADRVFATLACHSARRFGEHLDAAEQQAILSGLDDIPWAPTCPHGRPVAVAMDIAEIERRFSRR